MSETDRPTTQWPETGDPGLALLPFLYVAWSDGSLTSDEVDALRDHIRGDARLAGSDGGWLDSWLDPGQPPSPTDLSHLRERISELSDGSRDCASLTDLGIATVRTASGSVGSWASPPAREALRDLEELLGVAGGEAARAIVADRPRPPHPEPAAPPPLDAGALHAYLDLDRYGLRSALLERLTTEEFQNSVELPRAEYRERILGQLRILAAEGYGALSYPLEYGGKGDPGAGVAAFETLAFGDLSLLIKFGVQFGLFGGSILNLGTEKHHARYLPRVATLDLPGCYAMSESRHGSNVRDVETTATYLRETHEFEVHSPHLLSRKDWIGNAALHGRLATVFAQLVTEGHTHGVHAFLVPIRNEQGEALPGVHIEDCGHKVGLNGVDNGRLRFDRVRIPRDNLLDRFASVSESGAYTSPIASEGRRFFTMLGTLVAGRVSIAAASVSTAKTALAIAVRYASRRRQFGAEGEPERPILGYLALQRELLPRLAKTYALHFGVRDLQARFAAGDPSQQGEIEVLAAGLKAVASTHNLETIQACREACGGKGYLAENRFGRLHDDTDVFTTFEGANLVLLQLVAKGLLSRYRREMGDLSVWGIVRFLAERAGTRVAKLNPVTSRRHDEEHILDPAFHLDAMRWRTERLLTTVASRLKSRIDDGMNSFDALNECQDHVVELARAHVDAELCARFQEGVEAAPNLEIRAALQTVYELFALHTLETERAWYLESGYMEAVKTKAIRTLVNRRCRDLRVLGPGLVDGFGIPDALLQAPAGFVDESPEG